MFKGYKVKLFLSNRQKSYLIELFKLSCNIYNDCLTLLINHYEKTNEILDTMYLRKFFNTNIINEKNYKIYPIESLKSLVNRAYLDYKKYIAKEKGSYSYKSMLSAHLSIDLNPKDFYVKNERLFINSYISFNKEKNRGMKFKEVGYFPNNLMMYCPHLSFDGLDFYFSSSFKIKIENKSTKTNDIYSLGVDVGIKNWFTLSNGLVIPNINKSKRMCCFERRAKTILKKANNSANLSLSQHKPLSKNYFKLHKRYLQICRKQARIRSYYLYKSVNEIVNIHPKFVCIEDISVVDLTHDNILAKWIFNATFRKFRTILDYKCKWNGIEVLVANRYYPSSKICSNCGAILKTIGLEERTFKCPKCGFTIDRDLNAAINLSKIAKKIKSSSINANEISY